MVVNTMKYALLIRDVCHKNDEDVSNLSDDDVIYYYENSSWGNHHSKSLATKLVFHSCIKELVEPLLKRFGKRSECEW